MTTNYYDIGYARALEKLGMPVAAQRMLSKGKSMAKNVGNVLKGHGPSSNTLSMQEITAKETATRNALANKEISRVSAKPKNAPAPKTNQPQTHTTQTSQTPNPNPHILPGSLDTHRALTEFKDYLNNPAARGAKPAVAPKVTPSAAAPAKQTGANRWEEYKSLPSGSPFEPVGWKAPTNLKAPMADPELNAPAMSSTPAAPGKANAPVSSASTPEAVAAKAKGDPSFLRKHWLPIAGGIGAAGLGGYALMANRDSMGGTGQLPSGYGGGY